MDEIQNFRLANLLLEALGADIHKTHVRQYTFKYSDYGDLSNDRDLTDGEDLEISEIPYFRMFLDVDIPAGGSLELRPFMDFVDGIPTDGEIPTLEAEVFVSTWATGYLRLMLTLEHRSKEDILKLLNDFRDFKGLGIIQEIGEPSEPSKISKALDFWSQQIKQLTQRLKDLK